MLGLGFSGLGFIGLPKLGFRVGSLQKEIEYILAIEGVPLVWEMSTCTHGKACSGVLV